MPARVRVSCGLTGRHNRIDRSTWRNAEATWILKTGRNPIGSRTTSRVVTRRRILQVLGSVAAAATLEALRDRRASAASTRHRARPSDGGTAGRSPPSGAGRAAVRSDRRAAARRAVQGRAGAERQIPAVVAARPDAAQLSRQRRPGAQGSRLWRVGIGVDLGGHPGPRPYGGTLHDRLRADVRLDRQRRSSRSAATTS